MTVKNDWYKPRNYLHFDRPISEKKAQQIVTNSTTVAEHAFYPFISYIVESKKVSKNNISKKIKIKIKKRPIAYSAHIDSHIYSYYAKKLSDLYELELSRLGLNKSVLAFRGLGKSNINFAHEAFEGIKAQGTCDVLALDFSKFFDNLDHDTLKSTWGKLLGVSKLPRDHYNIFKSLTRYSKVGKLDVYEKFNLSKNSRNSGCYRICSPEDFRNVVRKQKMILTNQQTKGIPQGSPISALLSNIYMLGFDASMKSYIEKSGGAYYRYCDDMLFILPSGKMNEAERLATDKIKKLKIPINADKTEKRIFKEVNGILKADKMLQYLGFMFDGENTYLRSSSLARYSERMTRGVKLAKKTKEKFDSVRASKGLPTKELYKKKLYSRYSHLGARNFITYGLRAADTMNSKTIKKQLKPLWSRLQKEIEKN